MSERRVELILRLPNLPVMSNDGQLVTSLAALAKRFGGSLSRIERDHFADGSAVHVGREQIVKGRRS